MKIKAPAKWSITLLAIWLIALGLMGLLDMTNPTLARVLDCLAVAAGVMLILDR